MHDTGPYALFLKRFDDFTDVQKSAFKMIDSGDNCLIMSPTGSGKTEAALLPILDRVMRNNGTPGIMAIYVTPLRALNRDLMKRLEDICGELGITIGVRHGDTTQKERQQQVRHPPSLLITTPETLQNLFLSQGLRKALGSLKAIIIDEIHELYYNKRGAQLSVAVERLEELSHGFQRIGISATVGNASAAARFLCGERKCRILESGTSKKLSVVVEMPGHPKKQYAQFKDTFGLDGGALARIERVAELIRGSESTLMFANTRQVVESLGSKLLEFNKIEDFGGISVHHSSLDKEERIAVENQFKDGRVRSIIATSSLELGIDIGKINLVIQYGSPRQTVRLLQRVGRGGHRIGEVSYGRVVVASMLDALESAAIMNAIDARDLERAFIEENPLDVLLNQICGMVLEHKKLPVDKMFTIVRRSACFSKLEREMFDRVLSFANDNHIVRVRVDECGLAGRSRDYFFSNISVIPDVARFYVKNISNNRIISTLDERFVTKYVDDGSVFITKGLPWKVISIEKDTIFVEPSSDLEASIPDWEGEDIPVSFKVASRVFELFDEKRLAEAEPRYDAETYRRVSQFVKDQLRFFAPRKDAVVLEELENYAVMYVALGTQANEFLAKIIGSFVAASLGKEVVIKSMPYAVIVDYSASRKKADTRKIIETMKGYDINAVAKSEAFITNTDLFRYKFIQVAKLFGVVDKKAAVTKSAGAKIIEFYRGSPIFDETIRDLNKNYFDYGTVKSFLDELKAGRMRLEHRQQTDSPLSKELLHSVMHYRELLLPVLPSDKEIDDFAEDFDGKSVKMLCTYCGMVFSKTMKIGKDEEIRCISCKSPMAVMQSDEREDVIKKRLDGKRLKHQEQALYEAMMKEAGIVSTYGTRALIALSTYGIGITSAGRLLKLLRKDYKQFFVDLLETQKTFIKNKRFWQTG